MKAFIEFAAVLAVMVAATLATAAQNAVGDGMRHLQGGPDDNDDDGMGGGDLGGLGGGGGDPNVGLGGLTGGLGGLTGGLGGLNAGFSNVGGGYRALRGMYDEAMDDPFDDDEAVYAGARVVRGGVVVTPPRRRWPY